MTQEQPIPRIERAPLPKGSQGSREKVLAMFPSIIRAYNKGKISIFPTDRELGEMLSVHPATISNIKNGPELARLRENMKPVVRDKKHPKTQNIIDDLREQIQLLNEGKIRRLPVQSVTAKRHGVSTDTVSAILHGPELKTAYENRRIFSEPPDVVGHIESLLDEVFAGDRTDLPSNVAIGSDYNLSGSRVGQLIKEHNLHGRWLAARKRISEEAAKEVHFPKTKESAWFLGALYGKGALKNSGKKDIGFIFTHNEPEVLDAFKNSGEFLIKRTGLERQLLDRKNSSIILNHTGFARLLSPFSIESRSEQFESQDYKWLRDPRFLNSFVNGLFDSSGKPYFRDGWRRIEFATTNENIADFLLSTLKRFGIKQPRIDRQGRDNPKPKKVYFGTLPDLKVFAGKVTSVSPAKQAVLDTIAAYEPTSEEIVRQFGGNYPKQIYP